MAIIYKIGFEADASGVSSALNAIQKDIDKAFNNPKLYKGLSQELQEGVRQAEILRNALKKSTSDRGISFIRLNTELKQAGSSVEKMVSSLSGAGMSNSLNSFLTSLAQADRGMITLGKRAQEIGRVMTQSFKFSMAQEGLQALRNGLSQAIEYVKELDSAMNNIQIVTGKTSSEMVQVSRDAVESARQLRVAAKDYADASLIFYQQGLPDDEVRRRSETTIMAAKAAGESVSQMSEELTAVWNTYQMEGDRLANAASIGAKIGAETAVDFKYIAEAMGIAATSAAQLGTSYESLTSIIATVGEATMQSASVVGTAYRTIFTRLANLKLDGETEDGVKLGQITSQLAEVGVSALDMNGQLRDTDELIMELGTNWKNYSEAQQAAIAQVVGGTRQFGQFLALMQNFDKYQKNLNSALSETGSETLEEQYAISLDTIESRAINAAEAWKRAFAQIFTTDSLKNFYSMVENTGEVVEGLIDGFGGLPGILLTIGRLISSQVIDKLFEAGRMVKTIWDNRDVKHQQKVLDEQMNTALTEARNSTLRSYQQQFPDYPDYAQYRTDYDMSFDSQKILLTQQATQQTILLNEQIEHGNQLMKIQAQAQKDMVLASQQKALAELDNIKVLEGELELIQEMNRDLALNSKDKSQKKFNSLLTQTGNIMEEITKASRSGKGLLNEKEIDKITKSLKTATKQLEYFSQNAEDDGMAQTAASALRQFDKLSASLENGENNVQSFNSQMRIAVQYLSSFINQADDSNHFTLMNPDEVNQFVNNLKAAGVSVDGYLTAFNRLQASANADPFAKYRLSTQQMVQGFSNAAMSASMFVMSIQNITEAITSGEGSIAEYAGSLLMMIPSMVELYTEISTLVGGIMVLIAARKANTKATQADSIAEAASVPPKLASAGANATLLASILPITIAIIALVAIIGIIIAAWSAYQKSIEDAAQRNIDNAETLRTQRNEIEENTNTVKENEQAWRNAMATGDNISDSYQKLKESIIDLNTALSAAGVEQDKLNKLMAEALISGDLSKYYEEVEKQQEKLLEEQIRANKEAAESTVFLAERDATDTAGGRRWIGGDSAGKSSEIADLLKSYQETTEAVTDVNPWGGANLVLDTKDMAKFREQYEDLLRLKRDFEKIDATEADEYRELTEFLTEYADAYEKVKGYAAENVKLGEQLLSQTAESFNAYALQEGSMKGAEEAYRGLIYEVNEFAKANGLAQDEVEQLFEMLVAQNSEIQKFQNVLDVTQRTAEQIASKGLVKKREELMSNIKRAEDLDAQIRNKEAEIERIETYNKGRNQKAYGNTGYADIGTAMNNNSSTELQKAKKELKELEDQAKETDKAVENIPKDMENIGKEAYDAVYDDLLEQIKTLSGEDLEIAAKISLDGVDSFEDLTTKIEKYKESEIVVNIKTVEQIDQEIEANSQMQESLSEAIEEQREYGQLTYDTANSIDPKYLTKDSAGNIVLNTQALEDWNNAQREEARLSRERIDAHRELRPAIQSEMTDMLFYAEKLKGTGFEAPAQQLADAYSDFLATPINSFEEYDRRLDDLINETSSASQTIQELLENSQSTENFEDVSNLIEANASATGKAMQQLNEAYDSGVISIGDYNKAQGKLLKNIKETTKQTSKMLREKADEEGISEDLAKSYKEQADELDKYEKSLDAQIEKNERQQKAIEGLEQAAEAMGTTFSDIDWDYSPSIDFTQARAGLTSFQQYLKNWASTSESTFNSWVNSLSGDNQRLVRSMANGEVNFATASEGTVAEYGGAMASIEQQTANAAAAAVTIAGNALTAIGNGLANFEYKLTITEDIQADVRLEPYIYGNPKVQFDENGLSLSLGGVGIRKVGGISGGIQLNGTGNEATNNMFTNGLGGLGDALSMYGSQVMPFNTQGSFDPADISDFLPDNDEEIKDNGSGSGGDGGGGGDGSGGGDEEPGEIKDYERHERVDPYESVVERYDNINTELEGIANSLELIEESEDALYGTAAYKNLEKKEKMLRKEADAYAELKRQALEDLPEDQAKLQNALAAIGLDITPIYNEYGDVANAEDIQAAIDAYMKPYYDKLVESTNAKNAEVDAATLEYNNSARLEDDDTRYNDRVEAANKQVETAQADYDEAFDYRVQPILDAIELIGETSATVNDATMGEIESRAAALETYLERLSKKMEDRLAINETDLEILEYFSDKLGEEPKNAFQLLNNTVSQANTIADSMNAVREKMNEPLYKLQNGLYANEEEKGKLLQDLQEDSDTLLGLLEDIKDKNEEIFEVWTNTFESYLDDFDTLISKSDNYLDNLTAIQEILDNRGLTRLDTDLGLEVLDAQVEVGGDRLRNLNSVKTWTEKQAKAATDAYWNAVNSGADDQSIRYLKEQMDMANEAADEAYSDLLNGMNDYLSQVKDAQASAIEYLHQEWVNGLNGMFSDFDQAQDLYDHKLSVDQFYMHENDKLYEIDTMIRDINEQIENTTDMDQLERYNELLEELNAKKADGVQMTETDMEILKAQVELEKTRMSLEEARNAKNSMRLARDASGNWSYVYSQDNSDVEDQMQQMEDQMHNLDKMRRDALDEYNQFWLQVMGEYSAHLASFDQTLYDTDEGYRQWFDEKRKLYEQQLNMNADQIRKYLGETGISFDETALGYITKVDSITEANTKYQETANATFEDIKQATRDYADKAEEAMDDIGWSYEDTAERATEEIGKIKTQNKYLREDMFVTYVQAEDNMKAISDAQTAWQTIWTENMAIMIKYNEDFLKSVQDIAKEMSGLDYAQLIKDKIVKYGGEDYVYKPGDNENLDAIIRTYMASRGVKWETLSEEEKANYMENDEFLKLITNFSNAEQEAMQHQIDLASASLEEKKQAWLISDDWADQIDLSRFLDALLEAGLKDTPLYQQLRVARQEKMNVQRYFANLPVEEGGIPEARWWKSAEEYWASYEKYAKGGYTGNGSLSKGDHIPALLSSQEYVLNPEDTKNILHAVKVTRDIVQARLSGVLSNLATQYLGITPQSGNQPNELKQKVKIEANFPNVQNRTEIEAAFDNLINKAAQYILKDE